MPGSRLPGSRLLWLDVARGAAVVAVVLLHVRIFVYEPLLPEGVEGSGWRPFTEFFGPFRLPLLFAISGLLVSERVRLGWRDRRNAVRVASSWWLYLVWLSVFAVMSAAVTTPGVPFKIESPADYLRQLVLPDTTLWFVFALAVYVVVLTSLHRVRPAVVLGVFAVVAVLSGLAPAELAEEQWLHMLYFGVFFAAGLYLPATLTWFAQGRIAVKLGCTLAAFTVLLAVWQLTSIGDVVESSARLARDVAAVAVAVGVCALLCRVPALARPVAAVGRRTVPVYILQLPVIWALYLIPLVEQAHRTAFVQAVGPLLATAVVVAVSIGAAVLIDRTALRALFRLPTGIRDRIAGRRRLPERA